MIGDCMKGIKLCGVIVGILFSLSLCVTDVYARSLNLCEGIDFVNERMERNITQKMEQLPHNVILSAKYQDMIDRLITLNAEKYEFIFIASKSYFLSSS